MPWKGNDFQYDRSEAIAAMTSGLYGTERDERMDEIVDLENGIRKYWADKLRAFTESPEGRAYDAVGIVTAARLLDPYNGDGDPGFARTELDDKPEGTRWVKPV